MPSPLRVEAYKRKAVGDVAADLVDVEGKLYIVRLNGITAGHKRTLAEAERSIRVALIQDKLLERERALDAELRKKFPVEIDEKALAGVKLPAALEKPVEPSTPAPDAGQ